jgi:hypothetical protein
MPIIENSEKAAITKGTKVTALSPVDFIRTRSFEMKKAPQKQLSL